MKLFINGRFLTQEITGVQRFGVEIINELDKVVKPGLVEVLSPPGIINGVKLNNIKITEIGKKANNFWTQVTLPLYAIKNKGNILTLSGMCPIIKPGYFTAHDVTFFRHPESFSRAFRVSYKINYYLSLKRCKQVFTVSSFSKEELINTVGLKCDKVTVVYNGVGSYLLDNTYKDQSISKWKIEDKQYYLSVSSQSLHKNQSYIIECAKKYPNEKFVIVGSDKIKSFSVTEQEKLKNVIYTGYVSDEELFTLYKKTKGFIFPSLYEGFGLPPLEAIAMGVNRVAISDIPVFREIYPEGVYYFDPNDTELFDINSFDRTEVSEKSREYYLQRYTHKKVVKKIMEVIEKR